jgi:hypothetical protein
VEFFPLFYDFTIGKCLHPQPLPVSCTNDLYLAGYGNSNDNSIGFNRQQENSMRQGVATSYLFNLVRPRGLGRGRPVLAQGHLITYLLS